MSDEFQPSRKFRRRVGWPKLTPEQKDKMLLVYEGTLRPGVPSPRKEKRLARNAEYEGRLQAKRRSE